jgi:hypothetical protein
MEQSELLRLLVEKLERLGLAYFITGSTATIVYGEPRFTNDIDVVVDLPVELAKSFCAAFPGPEFYVSEPAVLEAIGRRHQFNILHPQSGLKIDVIIASETDFDRTRLKRRRQLQTFPDKTVSFAAPEDVILKKLAYFQEGGSEKHLRDIAGVLRVQGDKVDKAYILEWAARLGLLNEWKQVSAQCDQE